jgi:hypothetical protein
VWAVFSVGILSVLMLAMNADSRPHTIFDEAFELFELTSLMECPGYDEQRDSFLNNRGELEPASTGEIEAIRHNWEEFLASERGEQPQGCAWTITAYPAGFIATGHHTVIVVNPSNTVMGAPLPDATTGDFVMDATRYSDTSLGGFRGAATIPPRSIAVIALR